MNKPYFSISAGQARHGNKKAAARHTDIAHYISLFLDFADSYCRTAPGEAEFHILKRDHSLRVLENARMIAACLDPGPVCTTCILLSALFHDIGRFPQYALHKTFIDALSENHGLLGAKTLRQKQLLRALPAGDQKIICCTVALHNRRALPRLLPDAVRPAAAVVRDADKLDIIAVQLERLKKGTLEDLLAIPWLNTDPAAYSPPVYQDFMGGKLVRHADIRCITDAKLLLCSWIYDLHFTETRRMFLERGFLDAFAAMLPDIDAMAPVKKRLCDFFS